MKGVRLSPLDSSSFVTDVLRTACHLKASLRRYVQNETLDRKENSRLGSSSFSDLAAAALDVSLAGAKVAPLQVEKAKPWKFRVAYKRPACTGYYSYC